LSNNYSQRKELTIESLSLLYKKNVKYIFLQKETKQNKVHKVSTSLGHANLLCSHNIKVHLLLPTPLLSFKKKTNTMKNQQGSPPPISSHGTLSFPTKKMINPNLLPKFLDIIVPSCPNE
jgi:hypothetical protein